ncbi:MAG: alpha/beta hydrolase [Oscillospiraceae bacterium]|nr:alpha/beta hydrolase [Oscillospiraceae bacterium]
MNDMLREFMSYGQFLIPLLTVKHDIEPERVQWGDKQQYFLHYTAPARKADTVVIYLHGGGWNANAAKTFHYIGQFFAKSGYDCVLLNYRKVPKVHYEEIVSDVFEGYCEIRKHFSQKQNTRYILIGSSAGAHLGALLSYDADLQHKYKVDPRAFRGLITLAGPLCFDAPRTWVLNSLLKGLFQSKNREDWKQGEPIRKLRRGQKVPVLVIQSPHDGLIGMAQAKKFCGTAQNLGIRARLCEVETSKNTHSAYSAGIFFETPETSQTLGWVMKQIEAWSKFN